MSEQDEQNQQTPPEEQPQEPAPAPIEPTPEQPAAPSPEPVPEQPAAPPPPEPAQPVQPQPAVPTPPPPQDTNAYITWGYVLAGLGFVCCCCPLFGIAAIVLGAIAYSKGDQRGLWVIIAGVVSLFLAGGLKLFGGPIGHRWGHYIPRNIPSPWRNT